MGEVLHRPRCWSGSRKCSFSTSYQFKRKRMLSGYFCSSGRLRTSSPEAAVTSWVVVAKAKDAAAVFNLWKTFICFVDDYAWWKVPLVPAYRRLQGPVCPVRLRPAGQSAGSSLPDQHPDAARQTSPFALCWTVHISPGQIAQSHAVITSANRASN